MPQRTAEDVKQYPIARDEAWGPKSIRIVGAIFENGEVGFTYWSRKRGIYGHGNDCVTGIENWRKWAKSAEVIHIAQPDPKDAVIERLTAETAELRAER